MDQCTYQFSCPSCGSLLQAMLKQELTSVQCGECLDVFDVQLPSLGANGGGGPVSIDPSDCVDAPACATSGMACMDDGSQAVKQRRLNDGSAFPGVDSTTMNTPPSVEDESTSNLESSLQSCTAHRERILQMLLDDPENSNLMELRDQLTNAINQLQGTKSMVQRAQNNRGGGLPGLASAAAAAGAVGPDGARVKTHSSRKNKPQRCSVCGGIGHKSRTCSMAVQQQHPAGGQQLQQVQWTATTPGATMQTYIPNAPYSTTQMYAAAPGAAQMYTSTQPQGGYVVGPGGQLQLSAMATPTDNADPANTTMVAGGQMCPSATMCVPMTVACGEGAPAGSMPVCQGSMMLPQGMAMVPMCSATATVDESTGGAAAANDIDGVMTAKGGCAQEDRFAAGTEDPTLAYATEGSAVDRLGNADVGDEDEDDDDIDDDDGIDDEEDRG
mmetsp:Transcript_30869/g.51079  ORF Transcript_30869/g.51079 Transcript_30869/m.51079 type:complete len:442 (-) Transcript_30869:285-1610(-)|eukprot:CAMPEP_0119332750 /NCGR_PEP_ID=MMETSP1333-20130426/83552_1 /TAXON_ID=418940 /ORGANISM="Scyphosphaera apsteinii, Strain RCC1455" /LENGTH=441 /DNA_ID=CAMNT_0007342649 /DNA_START=50 /DNA_END=1375 /DNA_ORIENTATION=-